MTNASTIFSAGVLTGLVICYVIWWVIDQRAMRAFWQDMKRRTGGKP
jgi:uncharacterized membrane protein (DUF106 family)